LGRVVGDECSWISFSVVGFFFSWVLMLVLVVVEGRSLLGDVCLGVDYGVYFRCSTYIQRLCFVVSDLPVFVRLQQRFGF